MDPHHHILHRHCAGDVATFGHRSRGGRGRSLREEGSEVPFGPFVGQVPNAMPRQQGEGAEKSATVKAPPPRLVQQLAEVLSTAAT